MTWLRPVVITATVVCLVIANVVEFRIKRRSDHAFDLGPEASWHDKLRLAQYKQTQNIEQLLHVVCTVAFAILLALLWH